MTTKAAWLISVLTALERLTMDGGNLILNYDSDIFTSVMIYEG